MKRTNLIILLLLAGVVAGISSCKTKQKCAAYDKVELSEAVH